MTTDSAPSYPPVMNHEEAAKFLHIGAGKLRECADLWGIPYRRLSRKHHGRMKRGGRRYSKAALEAWLANRAPQQTTAADLPLITLPPVPRSIRRGCTTGDTA